MSEYIFWKILTLVFFIWNGYSTYASYQHGDKTNFLISGALTVLMAYFLIR